MKITFTNDKDLVNFLINKIHLASEEDTDTLCAYAEAIMGLPSASMQYDAELEAFSTDISTDDERDYGVFPDDIIKYGINVE